jgi:hypothetical protein
MQNELEEDKKQRELKAKAEGEVAPEEAHEERKKS